MRISRYRYRYVGTDGTGESQIVSILLDCDVSLFFIDISGSEKTLMQKFPAPSGSTLLIKFDVNPHPNE